MSESPIKESDIPSLSHIGSSVERHCSVVDSAYDTRQNRPGSLPSKAGFLSAAFPESSSQGTSIDLQSALTLLLSRMDKVETNIVNVSRVINLHHETITAQEQDNVSLYPDSSEYQGDDLGEEDRSSSDEIDPIVLK